MNRELLSNAHRPRDPYEQDFPAVVEHSLEDAGSKITTCRFNRRGNLLASGCQNGRALVWDFDTRGVAKTLRGHTGAVASVSFSRSGRRLLTSSADGTCILWDLAPQGGKEHVTRFNTSVVAAEMHPTMEKVYIACPAQGPPVVVAWTEDGDESAAAAATAEEWPVRAEEAEGGTDRPQMAVWDRTGEHIFLVDHRGMLRRCHYGTRTFLEAVEVEKGAAVKNMSFDREMRSLVLNCNDRTVRMLALAPSARGPAPAEGAAVIGELQHRFQDLVNRIQWTRAMFSPNGDYIVAAAADKAKHSIYLWERSRGSLVQILAGPSEGLEDFDWHPKRPIICAVSSVGRILVWSTLVQENWSAFAPDFKELEENVEYEEREDEFDIVPADVATTRKRLEEDAFVDILTIDDGRVSGKHRGAGSDDDDDDVEADYWRPDAIPNEG